MDFLHSPDHCLVRLPCAKWSDEYLELLNLKNEKI